MNAETCATNHAVGTYQFAKASDPESGSTVGTGDVITYTITISQRGDAAVQGATITDDLSAVLDDASWNDDVVASAGTVSRSGDALEWTGDLAVGASATVTYSVTAGATGDRELGNVVTTTNPVGQCDPDASCETVHNRVVAASSGGLASTGMDGAPLAPLGGLLVLAGLIAIWAVRAHRRRQIS